MEKTLLAVSVFVIWGCASFNHNRHSTSSDFVEKNSSLPFDILSTKDNHGRDVSYYLSNTDDTKLPLILFIQGSGCVSHWQKNSDGSISGGYQNVLLAAAKRRAHVLIVEKPGVDIFDFNSSPGTAEKCSDYFNQQHTLANWTEALNAALQSALTNPKIDGSKILAIGHSEGAISAASLATINSKISHVVLLSGSGVSQLFDFVVNRNPAEVENVYKTYQQIKMDPMNSTRFIWGHPYKRWASFMSESTVELLKKTNSKVLIIHGTADKSVPIQSSDAPSVELKRISRQFDEIRLVGADHSLNLPNEVKPAGMKRAFERSLSWSEF